MTDLRHAIRTALITRFGAAKNALDDETALFSSGMIDSLSVIDLVSFVEGQIGQPVPPEQITLENFDSIAKIVAFASTLGSETEGS
jgi:acyl carrier protein